MSLFGAPVAHEDHARRAVLAALAIQRSIKALRDETGWLDQALTALEHLPRCRETSETAVDIRLDLRNALWPVGELTKLQNVLREAEALAESIGDQPRLARVLIYLTHCLWGAGDNEG